MSDKAPTTSETYEALTSARIALIKNATTLTNRGAPSGDVLPLVQAAKLVDEMLKS